jgi:hypothetical protein
MTSARLTLGQPATSFGVGVGVRVGAAVGSGDLGARSDNGLSVMHGLGEGPNEVVGLAAATDDDGRGSVPVAAHPANRVAARAIMIRRRT